MYPEKYQSLCKNRGECDGRHGDQVYVQGQGDNSNSNYRRVVHVLRGDGEVGGQREQDGNK